MNSRPYEEVVELVARLRRSHGTGDLHLEAASTIEALQVEVSNLLHDLERAVERETNLLTLSTGSEATREALEWIADHAAKFRKGTDDWFELVEIEHKARAALAAISGEGR